MEIAFLSCTGSEYLGGVGAAEVCQLIFSPSSKGTHLRPNRLAAKDRGVLPQGKHQGSAHPPLSVERDIADLLVANFEAMAGGRVRGGDCAGF